MSPSNVREVFLYEELKKDDCAATCGTAGF